MANNPALIGWLTFPLASSSSSSAAAAVAVDIVLIAHVHRLKLDDPGRVLLIRRFRSFCRS